MKSIKGIVLALFVVFSVVACASPEEEPEVEDTTNPLDIWGSILEDKETLEEEPTETESEKEVIEVGVYPGQKCPFDTEEIDYVCITTIPTQLIINEGETCPEDTLAADYTCTTRETELTVLLSDEVCPEDTDDIHYNCISNSSKYDFIHGQTAEAFSSNIDVHAPGLTVWGGNSFISDDGDTFYEWILLSEKAEAVEFIIYHVTEDGRHTTLVTTDLLITYHDTYLELLTIENQIVIIFLPEVLEEISL